MVSLDKGDSSEGVDFIVSAGRGRRIGNGKSKCNATANTNVTAGILRCDQNDKLMTDDKSMTGVWILV
jgi:hypothetical protein